MLAGIKYSPKICKFFLLMRRILCEEKAGTYLQQ